MKFYTWLMLLIFSCTMNSYDSCELLKKSTLKNKEKTQYILTQCGFQKIIFETPDNKKLCGLFLDQSSQKSIKGTIIFCAGFYPGTKEGMTSFYALLKDQPYNFLFFDARGHNESEGSMKSYAFLRDYGRTEYLDIVGAINFIQSYNLQKQLPKNIFIHGICSGAFHAMHAINHLKKEHHANHKIVKGIIIDSGWNKLSEIAEPTINAEVYKQLRNSYFKYLSKPLSKMITLCYRYCFKKAHDTVLTIEQAVKESEQPIMFIHCERDAYAPIQPVQQLAQQTPKATTWWIDHDTHGDYHHKNNDLYKQKLVEFLDSSI